VATGRAGTDPSRSLARRKRGARTRAWKNDAGQPISRTSPAACFAPSDGSSKKATVVADQIKTK
jgi:hypothetical protein